MFDKTILDDAIAYYKRDFAEFNWRREEYKWKAVKTFQYNWDTDAADFYDMLNRSLAGTENLLDSKPLPKTEILNFAKIAPEKVCDMFKALFDENVEFTERIDNFKKTADVMHAEYNHNKGQHYQTENSISTYLWLKYPDRYYIYKFEEAKNVANELASDYVFKKGSYKNNLKNFYNLYNDICDYIKTDSELINLLQSHLTESHYSDKQLKTLTIDICFYISRYYPEKSVWFAWNYSPKITTETWINLLQDHSVFNAESLKVMKRFKDINGQATCKQLADKYGDTSSFYNMTCIRLAQRINKATGCPLYKDGTEENSKWWTVLFVGKQASDKKDGVYIWKLRYGLFDALEKINLSQTKLYEKKPSVPAVRYWWLNASPKLWSISNAQVGAEQFYTLYNDNNNRRRVFQNFLDVKIGDKVIGYEANPVKQIVALCEITAASDGKRIKFKKTESLPSPISYSYLRDLPELKNMEFFINPNGSLFKLTAEEYGVIMDIVRDENPVKETINANAYTKDDFLAEVYIPEQKYDALVSVLKNKRNIILQGAPGVGKTFAAKKLAYSVMGEKDENRVTLIQFHQNYSYEDFIIGYKPKGDSGGYELKTGIFYKFCMTAASRPDKDFFFIIDEINRGNMSKIFGELLMMIENDHRGEKITLAYGDLPFSVPQNLYIIGMMNTADRSLAMIDYALRRRFSFVEMEPAFNSDGFNAYKAGLNNPVFDSLIETIKQLNREIAEDKTLGKGFCIGHSYFCNWENCTISKMREVVEFDIIPTLDEYWFDDDEKRRRWSDILRGVVNEGE